MSSPLFDLRGILGGNASLVGMVVSVDGSTAQVATRNGIVEVAYEGSLPIRLLAKMADHAEKQPWFLGSRKISFEIT